MHTIITGASKGIGKALAIKFASQGSDLYLCARHLDALSDLAASIKMAYPNVQVHVFQADMSKKKDVAAFSTWVSETTNTIDVLINNAGIFLPGSILEEDDTALETLINTNLYSAYYLTRNVISLIRNADKGHVFNMCSIASFTPYASGGSYAISKFAMLGFSRVLREELKPTGIRVTSIMPGATWTDSWEGSGFNPERMMQAEDIAEMIWSAYTLPANAVVEDLIMRPQLGDL